MQDKDTNTTEEATTTKMPLPVNLLLSGFRIPFNVYLKEGENFIHLFTKWTLFDGNTRKLLDDKGITTIYIEGTPSKIAEYLDNVTQTQPVAVDMDRFNDYSLKKDNYHPIDKTLIVDKSLFVRNTTINFSIFLIDNLLFELLVEASVERPVEVPEIVFKARGDLAIKATDIRLYQEYLNSVLTSPDIPETMRKKCKALSIKENSKILVRDLLSSPKIGERMDEVSAVVGEIADLVLNKEVNVYDLLSLKNYDFYTYTHSVNVAVMSIAMGSALGFDRGLIEKLGIGALMHDIGKSVLPLNILNKQGTLTDEEFSLVKTHVVEGVKILENKKDFPKESLVVVLQHHERLSGRGYPFGLAGEKMKAFGRISSIVDCYDCLITPRPFRYAYTPYMSLSILSRETKETDDFDPHCLKTFIKTLGKLSD